MNLLFSKRTVAVKRAVSFVCLAIFLFVQLLAVSPSLHERFHPDAGKADHQCAVTLLSRGMIDSAVAAVSPIPAPAVLVEQSIPPISIFPHTDRALPPGRGPPSFLS